MTENSMIFKYFHHQKERRRVEAKKLIEKQKKTISLS